jgi:hypothetical protein
MPLRFITSSARPWMTSAPPGVDDARIARAEPAVAKMLRVRRRIVEVAACHAPRADADLADFAGRHRPAVAVDDPYVDVRMRLPDAVGGLAEPLDGARDRAALLHRVGDVHRVAHVFEELPAKRRRRAPAGRGQLGERWQASVPRDLAHELLRARRVAGDLTDLELAAERDDRHAGGGTRHHARPHHDGVEVLPLADRLLDRRRRQDATDARAHHLEHEVVVPYGDQLRLAGRARRREEREQRLRIGRGQRRSRTARPGFGALRLQRDRLKPRQAVLVAGRHHAPRADALGQPRAAGRTVGRGQHQMRGAQRREAERDDEVVELVGDRDADDLAALDVVSGQPLRRSRRPSHAARRT